MTILSPKLSLVFAGPVFEITKLFHAVYFIKTGDYPAYNMWESISLGLSGSVRNQVMPWLW